MTDHHQLPTPVERIFDAIVTIENVRIRSLKALGLPVLFRKSQEGMRQEAQDQLEENNRWWQQKRAAEQ